MPDPRTPWIRVPATVAAVGVVLAITLGACGSSGSDPAETGPQDQAVEKLRDFGLTAKQAQCVVDDVGAETVVGAIDLNAFSESQQYQDAAKDCIDG